VPAEEMDRFLQQSQILMARLNEVNSAHTLVQNTVSASTRTAEQ
jgi:hypothetical protein